MRSILIAVIVLLATSFARAQLRADDLALIVNKNNKESVALAEFYAKARGVPANRILALDLPHENADDILFDQYERVVAPQVRNFVTSEALRDRIKCVVTFYGVPLRVTARVNSPNDTRELSALRTSLAESLTALGASVNELEALAREVDPSFASAATPNASPSSQLIKRYEHASAALTVAIQKVADETKRQEALKTVTANQQKLRSSKPTPIKIEAAPPTTEPATAPTAPPDPIDAVDVASLAIDELLFRRFDPAARARVRDLASNEGIASYARIVESQIEYLVPDATDAAFDNELALVCWPVYPRPQWQPNPLSYERAGSRTPPVLMTSRLDGPTPQIVREMINTSVNIERSGLKGRIVVDAGGAAMLDPQKNKGAFWPFDQHFSNFATLVRTRAPRLALTYDDAPAVLKPRSVRDVALYTGWYSVAQYVPSCTFARGAVGYHVASYEMVTLHDPKTPQWCANLLRDGCVATIGAVSEPYLHAFPLPDDFLPLLMTGKLTLAETYWRTTPLVSWKMCLVGDPLYTPYKSEPAMKVSDLPERLQRIFGPVISR